MTKAKNLMGLLSEHLDMTPKDSVKTLDGVDRAALDTAWTKFEQTLKAKPVPDGMIEEIRQNIYADIPLIDALEHYLLNAGIQLDNEEKLMHCVPGLSWDEAHALVNMT